MKKILSVIIFISFFSPTAFAAEVKNLTSVQSGNRVMAQYDLEGTEAEANVSVSLTVGGKTYSAKELHIEGDLGKVTPGRGKKIYWNVLQDFPRGYNGNAEWDVSAGGAAFTDPVTGMEFVFVKGGCFDMGDTFGDGESREKPVHEVCIDDFYMGKYEVTVGQFRRFVNDTGYRTDAEKGGGCYTWTGSKWEQKSDASWKNPYFSQTDSHPVACVSWNDATAYAEWQKNKTGKAYRLPTEAEWEYAARSGGKKEKWSGTSSESELGNYAWYDKNSSSKTHPVGQKRPNGLGLYDMSGNVWEWVQDRYGEKYYKESSKNNPTGSYSGSVRVLRGGSWLNGPRVVRAADRSSYDPGLRGNGSGFRLLVSAVQ